MEETLPRTSAPRPGRLWTTSFILLWQGQLVSILGDVVYAIALGFWILAVTGSTALMGGLMAASTLPRILASPIAGVIVDRFDRRGLMIWMDCIRGAAVVAIGVVALVGLLKVWMVFAAGVILGLCGAFFSPAPVHEPAHRFDDGTAVHRVPGGRVSSLVHRGKSGPPCSDRCPTGSRPGSASR